MSNDAAHLWERLPGEPSRAFDAFGKYRDMGAERSLAKVARALGKTNAVLETWSVRWSWVSRAGAYDDDVDRRRLESLERLREEMNARHVQQCKALQLRAIERLAALDPSELKPADVLNFLMEAARLERLALGVPVKVVEQRKVTDVPSTTVSSIPGAGAVAMVPAIKGMTDAELRALREQLKVIQERQQTAEI